MNILFDINEDKKEKMEWLSEGNDNSFTMDDLTDYAINGLQRCEGYCGSEDYLGEDACYCVRARFPTIKHFNLYEAARELGKELAYITILGNLSQEEIPLGINRQEILRNE